MAKENICGKAFEELTEDELMEYDDGAVITVTILPATTLLCLSISIAVSASVSICC